jgi:hypothetical protein
MLDRILIGSSVEPNDPNFKNVTLLLHGDGSNGAQNNTFIDSSTNNFTITRNGNTTQGSFSPYGSNWSNYFDGSGDYLTAPSNAAFDFSTSDFTVECWFIASAVSSNMSLVNNYNAGSAGWGIQWRSDVSEYRFFWGDTVLLSYAATPTVGAWTHIAVSRSGTSLKMFVNGVQVASATNSTSLSGGTTVVVGAINASGYTQYFNGYISNVRVVKGTAVYTAAFTPSTTPLTAITNTSLLTCAYNRFRDGSTNNFTITRNGDVKVTNLAPFAPSSAYSTSTNGGSAYFDGNEDFLTSPDNAAVQFGSGDFTIEMWVYFSSANIAEQQYLLFNGANANSYGPYKLYYNGANNLKIYGSSNGSSWDVFNGLNVITTVVSDCWYHIALVRSGSTFSAYANGVRQSTASVSGSLISTGTPVRIAAGDAFGSYNFNGYMSNFRMVKGTAVYDPSQSSLTIPTAPVTAITNTSLLLNFTNAAIFDNSMKNDLETVGNAQISTSVKKFGTGSMAFDGSGDYLYPAASPNLAMGTGDFTVEGWIYATGTPSDSPIFECRSTGSATDGFTLTAFSSSVIRLFCGSALISSSSTTYVGQWVHLAVARVSGTTTFYINGTSVGSTTSTINWTNQDVIVGGGRYSAGSSINVSFTGYIDDFRITKGVARYTANFTPPTAAFPNK